MFLLSPAYCGGKRAGLLLRPESTLDLATRLRGGSLTLGEAFAFMSGLYFRGKLAYARRFATARESKTRWAPGIAVITPTRGLQDPDSAVTADLLREFATVDVSADDERYRAPLDRDLQSLAAELEREDRFVLLGSIATGKYVDALVGILGRRLHFPVDFVGRGDMSRGGLLLRHAESGVELPYAVLDARAPRHGARPPKLPPKSHRDR
jgi:hypothetical protein